MTVALFFRGFFPSLLAVKPMRDGKYQENAYFSMLSRGTGYSFAAPEVYSHESGVDSS